MSYGFPRCVPRAACPVPRGTPWDIGGGNPRARRSGPRGTRHAARGTHLTAALLTLALLLPSPATGQSVPDSVFTRSSPFLVKYGKWVAVAGAVGMGLKASEAHHDADRAFNQLESYCRVDPTRCDRGPGGRYLDPVAEGYYQTSLRRDRQARGWLLGGEAALVGAAGMFVWELTRPKHRPKNIPFEPEFQVLPGGSRMGLRMEF